MTTPLEQTGKLHTDLEWFLSQKGNPYTNQYPDWNIAVFKRGRKKKDGTYRWSYRTQRQSPSTDPSATVAPYSVMYDSDAEAKQAAIDSLIDLEKRLQ